MSRFARSRRVFFIEEPIFADNATNQEQSRKEDANLHISGCELTGVRVCTPILPAGLTRKEIIASQRELLNSLLTEQGLSDYIAWYYTPMAREFSNGICAKAVIYDCMDELSAFTGAPSEMQVNERELFSVADLVFTGGASLYEAKRKQHGSVHQFASSVDFEHFARARSIGSEPCDQEAIPRPRLGYAGVIDERMDIPLLATAAALRPEWHFILVGPVVKIDPESLPTLPNIHYLGLKKYDDLPSYFAGWDIGMLPFALNKSTRFISPTKTPEYLAAGLRVISTPIRDVITPYGDLGLAGIVNDAGDFVRTADSMLKGSYDSGFRERADAFLSRSSWDKTWADMNQLIDRTLSSMSSAPQTRTKSFAAASAESVAHV